MVKKYQLISIALVSSAPGIVRAQNQNMFVSEHGTGDILEITPGGAQSTFASTLSYPAGVAFDSSGNLYVSLDGNETIAKITPGGAQSIFASEPV